jgi:hypothetical protein
MPAGRPASYPRLQNLDPLRVAESVVGAAMRHVASLVSRLDAGATCQIEIGGRRIDSYAEIARVSTLGRDVQALTRWAQTGEALDWSDSGMAADTLLSLISALYTRAADGTIDASEFETDVDATRDFGVVILAAQARIRLCHGIDVPVRELAALASISPDALRRGDGAKLRRTRDGIACEDARRWLSSRGIIVERRMADEWRGPSEDSRPPAR